MNIINTVHHPRRTINHQHTETIHYIDVISVAPGHGCMNQSQAPSYRHIPRQNAIGSYSTTSSNYAHHVNLSHRSQHYHHIHHHHAIVSPPQQPTGTNTAQVYAAPPLPPPPAYVHAPIPRRLNPNVQQNVHVPYFGALAAVPRPTLQLSENEKDVASMLLDLQGSRTKPANVELKLHHAEQRTNLTRHAHDTDPPVPASTNHVNSVELDSRNGITNSPGRIEPSPALLLSSGSNINTKSSLTLLQHDGIVPNSDLAASILNQDQCEFEDHCSDDSQVSAEHQLLPMLKPMRKNDTVRWVKQYLQLQKFCSEKGHCLVPTKSHDYPQLGPWVSSQRYQYKKRQRGILSSMTDGRLKALDALGFVWSIDVPWEERFDELVSFKTKYGHCKVPRNYTVNPELGRWVHAQRTAYKKFRDNKRCKITQERIDKLDVLGFIWDAHAFRHLGRNVTHDKEAFVVQSSS